MELQFPHKTVSCLRRVKADHQTMEETQELRMPEEMPDIGRVLGAWGQVLLRSKQWRDGSMVVSGGVMTWIMYLPEGEDQPQTAQAWIPFQIKSDLPETKHDGMIRVCPLLKSVDARSTSARKMVARVCVSIFTEAFVRESVDVNTPDQIPEDIQLLKQTYPLLLPKEAGEKEFSLEEELSLPSSAPRISKIVRFSLQPELIDKKVLSGKVVFRGVGLLHVLYFNENTELCTWDFEIPFSQYAELDADYEQEADARVLPIVTGMELDTEGNEKLRLKAALIGQYVIYDRDVVTVAVDAYSPLRDVTFEMQELELPAILERKQQTVSAQQTIHQPVGTIVDAVFYPDHPQIQQSADVANIELSGVFQLLYKDEQGQLQGTVSKWNEQQSLPISSGTKMEITAVPSGMTQGLLAAGEIKARGDMYLDSVATASEGIRMMTLMNVGQSKEPEENRPNLILRRKGTETLWDLAKKCGSTVEAIQKANQLSTEPEIGQILLIPIQ